MNAITVFFINLSNKNQHFGGGARNSNFDIFKKATRRTTMNGATV